MQADSVSRAYVPVVPPHIRAANEIIEAAMARGQPVWLEDAVAEVLRRFPDQELSEAGLRIVIRRLLIERRWAVRKGRRLA